MYRYVHRSLYFLEGWTIRNSETTGKVWHPLGPIPKLPNVVDLLCSNGILVGEIKGRTGTTAIATFVGIRQTRILLTQLPKSPTSLVELVRIKSTCPICHASHVCNNIRRKQSSSKKGYHLAFGEQRWSCGKNKERCHNEYNCESHCSC